MLLVFRTPYFIRYKLWLAAGYVNGHRIVICGSRPHSDWEIVEGRLRGVSLNMGSEIKFLLL